MKRSILSFILLVGLISSIHAQARLTDAIKQRLEGKTDFYEIKTEIRKYFSEERQKLIPGDSIQKRLLNRQFKFWNRWLFDCESRLEPDGSVANWAQRMYQFELREDAETNIGRAANSSWSLVGPVTVDIEDGIGRVNRLGFHPTNSQIIYAGSARGGLWRSSNAGSSWSNIAGYLPSLGISGIEINHDNPDIIYVLSGEGDAWFSGGYTATWGYVSFSNGVFKSTDNGVNWSKTADFESGIDNIQYVGFQMRQDPNNSNTYLAATSNGLYKTTNGGSSWTKPTFINLQGLVISYSSNGICVFDIEYKPGSSTTIYAGAMIRILSNGNIRFAFFRSTDGGQTFNEVNLSSEIVVSQLIRFEIGVTPANPGIVFLLCGPGFLQDNNGSNDTFLGFLKSTNSGVSFSNLTTEPDVFGYNPSIGYTFSNQCFYDMALAISPTNANYIFTGGLVVFRSTDGGNTFNGNTSYFTWETGETIHPDIHDLKYNPLDGRLYASSDGGVFYSANNGGAWNPIFNGLSITQFYHAESDNENNHIWGGTQDNGHLEQSSGSTFIEFDGGDGFDVMTDNIVGNGNDSYWTNNGGMVTSGNFNNLDITPPDPLSQGRDFGYMDMHPSNEDYIYVGYSDAVWYSPERGDEWKTGTAFNRLDAGVAKGEWCIQSCMSNASRLYSAGGGKMWRVDGIDFNEATTGTATSLATPLYNEGFPNGGSASSLRKITDILVHPSNSSILWVTASGFTEGAKVFAGTSSGSTWDNISYNLPNIPANCLLRDSDGTLYVGMDAGVYYLPPGENSWIPYYNGLPRVPVTEMFFVTESGLPYIYVSTFGRGLWKSQKFTGCSSAVSVTSHLEGPRFYQAGTSITSTSLIDGYAGTRVHFQAGNSITLQVGFEGKEGVEFTGYILPCNTGPFPDIDNPSPQTRFLSPEPPVAIIESIKSTPSESVIKIRVREEKGPLALKFSSSSGDYQKEVVPFRTYSEGVHMLRISKQAFNEGYGFVTLVDEKIILDYHEYGNEP